MRKPIYLLFVFLLLAVPVTAQAYLLGHFYLPADTDALLHETSNRRFGLQIVAGDFDGDGRRDVAASSPVGDGMVYVTLGAITQGADIDVAAADFVFTGASGSEAGWSLAAGDVIGDSTDDLVIGAPSASGGRGRIYVFEGPLTAGMALSPQNATATYTGNNPNSYASWSLAIGDFDGDGKGELAVGACGVNPQNGTGAVYLVHEVQAGAQSLTAASVSYFRGRGRTGCSLAATDFDGDGFEDLIIGSHGSPQYATASFAGDVHIVYGRSSWLATYNLSDTPKSLDATVLHGVWRGGNFGYALATEDVNEDGFGDLLIGEPEVECLGCTLLQRDGGSAFLVLGAPSSGTTPADRPLVGAIAGEDVAHLVFYGEDTFDQAGISVAGAGDAVGTHSGREMLIGSAVGKTYLHGWSSGIAFPTPEYRRTWQGDGFVYDGPYFGPDDPSPTQFDVSLSKAWMVFEDTRPDTFAGRTVAGAGDIDGDGHDDIAIGAPHQLQFDTANKGPGEVHLVFGE